MGQHNPCGSGLLREGGLRRFKIRRSAVLRKSLRNFPDVHISDTYRVRTEVPDYDPDLAPYYTQRELLLLTEKILLTDEKPANEAPVWLNVDRLKDRYKHEIYCSAGIPDPAIASGLYWRTHPDGRRWRTPAERRVHGSSFYR